MNPQPAFNLYSVINLLGVGQALFFAALLWVLRRRTAHAHTVLAGFLAAYALVMLDDVLMETKYVLRVPHLSLVFTPLVFALGPLIYAYVLALTQPTFRFRWRQLAHLLPLLGFMLVVSPYLLLSAAGKLRVLRAGYLHPAAPADMVVAYIGMAHVLLYLGLSMRAVRRYAQAVRQEGQADATASARWLLSLMAALGALWVVWLLNAHGLSVAFQYAETTLFTACVYGFGFRGISQLELFRAPLEPVAAPPVAAAPAAVPEPVPPARKYEKAGIPPEKVAGALLALQHQMEVEKVYRNNELTLPLLAKLIHMPGHHVSQLLNEHLRCTFYEYVNRYRVEDVKAALADPRNEVLTILALAWEAGFSSKSSFNIAFKKHTGLSPSAYKSQLTEPRP